MSILDQIVKIHREKCSRLQITNETMILIRDNGLPELPLDKCEERMLSLEKRVQLRNGSRSERSVPKSLAESLDFIFTLQFVEKLLDQLRPCRQVRWN